MWEKIDTAPDNVDIITKIDDGEEREVKILRRSGSLWFIPGSNEYVYYQPTHWHPIDRGQDPADIDIISRKIAWAHWKVIYPRDNSRDELNLWDNLGKREREAYRAAARAVADM